MAETKEEIADQRDRLVAENEQLRAQLAAVGGARVQQPQHTFQLSEGDRQELEIRGVVNVGGRMMTKSDVEQAMKAAGAGQEGVKIADAPEGTRIDPATLPKITGPGVAGVDYVYPSVQRGKIDPKLAGTPGISGPAAGK
jgi:hypothetical protein